MNNRIKEEIEKIEKTEDVKVLFAIESGSRAWGFESVDSDYDVRFIYLHKRDFYLSIFDNRDVLEYPINDLLDISGWDLKKALQLMYKSNPTLIEWIKSPIVYKINREFHNEMTELAKLYFSEKACMYHYLNMARQNFKKHFNSDKVKIKKYFYVLRPLFACMWIKEKKEAPPIEFELLYKELTDKNVIREVEILLDKKKNSNEYDLEIKNSILDKYIMENLKYFSEYIESLKGTIFSGEELDKYFVKCIEKYN